MDEARERRRERATECCAAKTAEQREARLKVQRNIQRSSRCFPETPEQTEVTLEAQRNRYRDRRTAESAEQMEARLARQRATAMA